MNDPSSPPDTRNTGRLVATSFLAAVLTLVGYGLALALAADRDRETVGFTIAAATLLVIPLVLALTRLARGAAPVRWTSVIAAALLGQSLLPLSGALLKLGDPLVSSHWRCGTGDAMIFMLSPVPAFGGALVAFAAAYWGAWALGVRGARMVKGVSLVMITAVLVLAAVSCATVATRPQARAALTSVPIAGELPRVTLAPAMPVRVDTAGPLLVWRSCDQYGCDLSIRQPVAPRGESVRGPTVRVGDETLRVRVDRGLDLALFESSAGRMVGAFRLRSGEPTDVTWGTLRGRIAPPLAWLVCALAGLALSLVVFARSGRVARELARWRDARAGMLSEDGVVRIEGEATTAVVQGAHTVAPGPVLVFEDAARVPFREAASVSAGALRVGTRGALEASIAVARAGSFALAAAVALWSALPLIAASLIVR